VNLRGEVIGLNTAIASSSGGNEGIGFTIPINIAMFVGGQLIEQGSVIRAMLGVQLDSQFDAALARELGLPHRVGARISQVNPNTAAEEAGLRPGDVILSFDSVQIEDDLHLVNQVKMTPVGKTVDIVLFRGGQATQVQATVRAEGS